MKIVGSSNKQYYQMVKRESLAFKPNDSDSSYHLDVKIYQDFVDRYIVRNLRHPSTPLPTNLIENDIQ
jgi:hypothetical protein